MDLMVSQSVATPAPTSFLSVPEVAQRWNCEHKLIYSEIAQGRLAGLRIGKKLLRVSLEEVLRYEKAQASKESKE